jgi:hypothetical protein
MWLAWCTPNLASVTIMMMIIITMMMNVVVTLTMKRNGTVIIMMMKEPVTVITRGKGAVSGQKLVLRANTLPWIRTFQINSDFLSPSSSLFLLSHCRLV